MFIGRRNELLREELTSPRPSLALIDGRRRVGKSTLIREAIKDEARVLYQATRVTSSLSLEALKLEISRTLGSAELLNGIAEWLPVFHYVARAAERRPGLIIVLDEFPYLADADPALPSVIQKFWDSGAARPGNLELLLCGSTISHMEELLAERNPLYGRKTFALDLARLSFPEAAEFVPRYRAEDKLETCAVFGGIPFYLELLDRRTTLQSNIIRLMLTPTGSLVDEPVVLLQSELREISRYASVLAAIDRRPYQAWRHHRQSKGNQRLQCTGSLPGEARAHALDPHRQVDGRQPEGARPTLLHCRPVDRVLVPFRAAEPFQCRPGLRCRHLEASDRPQAR